MGRTPTEADWRLFTTLIRFDPVYHLHFKCNRKRIIDYPNLWAYVRELYQWPGVADTVNMDHIVRHYHYSHDTINPNRILPINPGSIIMPSWTRVIVTVGGVMFDNRGQIVGRRFALNIAQALENN